MGIDDIDILKEPGIPKTSVRQDKHALERALEDGHRLGMHVPPMKPLVNCPLCRAESKEKDD